MSAYYQELSAKVQKSLSAFEIKSEHALSELTIIVDKDNITDVCEILKLDSELQFDLLVDVCGVDYLNYEGDKSFPARFASVYHLQSVSLNHRIRVIAFLDEEMPIIDSVVGIWRVADWFEREAFDLFGIIYNGHPDLRRILTDYGFIGHPMRKEFPVIGNVEMRYDHEKQRVVYEPVSIENRVIIPRTKATDNRYINKEKANEE
ncbi:MAG: NADH-quinone oxidoreductase subunit C [Gammaproteobacteria bacterium]|nr:NADH-quinone oxidoreductase subunit C [Gammaproteobacteria bacterium]